MLRLSKKTARTVGTRMKNDDADRLIVAITGASGTIYGIRLLEALRETPLETHLVMTDWAKKTMAIETDRRPEDVVRLADRVYREDNLAAAISSGSFLTTGMVIVPCSVKTLGGIASGVADNLVTRAADVTLKEQRKLVLAVRESPLHSIHLENMLRVSRAGAVIAPPMPAFYAKPESIQDLIDHTVGRLLDLFGIEHELVHRWGG
jgi:4-hydroxy-3-polyprenylbenzoate decarboxylase